MSEDRSDDDFDRLLRHALSVSPRQEPPPGFSRAMAEWVAEAPETAGVEIWLTRVAVSLAAVATGACAVLEVHSVATRIGPLFGRAPWPLLLAAATAIAAFELVALARPGAAAKR